MKLFGLTARVLASVLVFGVLTPMFPATAALSPVISPAAIQSPASAKVAPKNTKAPTISGTTRVPNQLSVTNGTWSGAPTSYTYQWFRCNSAVKKAAAKPAASCATIGSATASTYALTDADAGKHIVARVTGLNASGTMSFHSASKGAIIPRVIAPKNTVAATISGTAQVSRVLTASNGTWIESPAEFGYQWYQCSKAVKKASTKLTKGCKLIANQTDSTYQLTSSDARKFVLTRVSASNNAGSASVFTATAGAVAVPSNYAPSLFAAPSMEFSGVDSEEEANAISGSPMLGSVLVASKGQWLGFPLPEVSYSFWYRCDLPHSTAPSSRPSDCYAIQGSNGANGETYLVVADDVGKYLAFEVIATNASGVSRYFTPTTGGVIAPPTLLNPPVLSGSPRFGQTLSVTDGRWSVAPGLSLSYTYKWFRCDSGSPVISAGLSAECEEISGQTTANYNLASPDLGSYVVASVTATSSLDESVSASSNVSTQIKSVPTVLIAPIVTGPRAVGETLSSAGSWAVYPAADSTYQWYRCSSPVAAAVTTLPNQCSIINGATNAQYSQGVDDVGKYITVSTSKSNELGSLTAWSSVSLRTYVVPVVAVGHAFSCAMLQFESSVKCWGGGDAGFDAGVHSGNVTPRIVPELSDTVAISAGGVHACALGRNGSVKCWGDNRWGQLGNNTENNAISPTSVVGLSDVVLISLGRNHSCAMTADGSVKCWGLNDDGQLGNGLKFRRWTPVAVVGISNAESISAGREHTCAMLQDRTLKCWGANNRGQLGGDPSDDRLTPQVVPGVSNVVSVSAGEGHTCAVLVNGQIECWGSNNHGQLGDGSTTDRFSPVLVSGITDALSVSTGSQNTCAVLENRTLKCWGKNDVGQLGDGSTTDSSSPVSVAEISNAVAVSVFSFHTCATRADLSVACWGINQYGQLGDGSRMNRFSPVTAQFE